VNSRIGFTGGAFGAKYPSRVATRYASPPAVCATIDTRRHDPSCVWFVGVYDSM
jgi:hypothetical protein